MKVKVLKFEVSNAANLQPNGNMNANWYTENKLKIVQPETIEDKVNEVCAGKNVVDIVVTSVDTKYHNNGGCNTVELWYTIKYQE